jgi:general secretion pathway protein D
MTSIGMNVQHTILRFARSSLSLLAVLALGATLVGTAEAKGKKGSKDTDKGASSGTTADAPPAPERIRPAVPGPAGVPLPPPPQTAPAQPAPRDEPPPNKDGTTTVTTSDASGAPTSTKKLPCAEPKTKVTMTYDNAPLADVAKYMAQITCRNFILGEDLKGQVTIISHQQVSVGEAYEAFLSALEVAGYTTVTVGKATKIVAVGKAANAPLKVYEGDEIPGTDNFVTQIITLDNVSVSEISTVVKELSGPSAKVIAYAPTNTLMITDAAYNIRRVYRIVKQLDVAAPRSKMEVVPLRYATAADVERILEEVYGVTASASGGSSSGGDRPSTRRRRRDEEAPATNAGASSTNVGGEAAFISKIIADERTNSLILMANEEALVKVKELIGRLDIDIDPASRSQIHVIYLEHANAEDVAGVLQSLSSGTGPRGGGGGGTGTAGGSRRSGGSGSRSTGGRGASGGGSRGSMGGGKPNLPGGAAGNDGGSVDYADAPTLPGGAAGNDAGGPGQPPGSSVVAAFDNGVRITADENTNSLVLIAAPEDFRILKGVIDRLDIPRRQVYVETTVVEVASEDEFNAGIGYHFGSNDVSPFATGYASSQLNASSFGLNVADLLSGLAMGVFGEGIDVGVSDGQGGTATISVPAFGIALNALQSNSAVDILSNPSLLVVDNEEATINIGRNVPFPVSAGRDNNNNPIITYQREDVGITLQVTPQINESNYVTLELNLEVAEVEEDSSGLDVSTAGFITSKRQTENVVVVRDNQTIVIGGLIGNTATKVRTKIPILGDIPLLGALFRGSRKTDRKTNLLIFLTPHVINEPADLEEVYRMKWAQREEFMRRFYGKSKKQQEEELRELLGYSMNVIDEPSRYREKVAPSSTKDEVVAPSPAPAPAPAPEK